MPKLSTQLSKCAVIVSAITLSAVLYAQTPASDQGAPTPVAYASVNELNSILKQLQDASQRIQADLDKTRIDKWKIDASNKREMQSNVDSIKRNLQSALPEIITQLNNSPEDLSSSFKLYRNLDALYDVFGTVAESAGAFGSKDEYQSLSNDLTALQNARHALGDRVQTLATNRDGDLSRLRNQVRALQAAIPPAPPKKIIVDDTEPPKKPAKKKAIKPATAKPATTPPNTTTTPPSK
jgi:DNA repair ATPase RecN